MEMLVWVGVAITLLGLAGVIGCIVFVVRAKRADLSDGDLRARLQRAVAWNLGAFFTSALGLAVVAAGLFLT